MDTRVHDEGSDEATALDGVAEGAGRLGAWLTEQITLRPEFGSAICYPDGTSIHVADPGDPAIYLVLRGEVAVYVPDRQGKACMVRRVGAGGVFGEAALLSGTDRSDEAIALGAVELARVSCAALRERLREAACRDALLDHFGRQLSHNQERIALLLAEDGTGPAVGPGQSPRVQ